MYFSAKYWAGHTCDETPQSQENKLTTGANGTSLKIYTGLGMDPVPTSQLEHLIIHGHCI